MVTRRKFVKKISLIGGSCLLSQMLPLSSFGNYLPKEKARVAITRGRDIGAITREALGLIGGVGRIVKKGQSVFIKPNYISGGLGGHDPVTAGEIAHPDVVATVAEECVKAGAARVMIGEWVERPPNVLFGGQEGKEGAQVRHRIDLLNKKYGHKIFLINLMVHTSHFVYYPSITPLKTIAIPDIVARCHVKITIPSLKTHHEESPVTMGMKNWMGIMPSSLYGEPRYKLHEAGIHQVIVDINKALRPDLTVIDGSYGMEGEGTTMMFGGRTVDVSSRIGGFLVIAGYDPVATDVIGTRVISRGWQPIENEDLGTPYYVHHLRMAHIQRLGELRRSRITVKGQPLERVSMNWEMPGRDTYPEIP